MMKTSVTLAAAALALLLQIFALPADARPIRCGNCGTVLRVESIWYEDRDGRYNRDSGREGAVLGAIIGGLVGNQVGSGSGRRAATVAGAVIGGSVGRNVDQGNGPPGRTYEDRARRCRIVEEPREEQRIAGYNVEYRYRGEVYMSRLDYDPGDRLRVRVSVTPAE